MQQIITPDNPVLDSIARTIERTMLAEVADWHRSADDNFTLIKALKLGIYSFKFDAAPDAMRLVVGLTEAEAAIFNRHVTCPARLSDLLDLPRRLQVAKLHALVS